VGDLADPQIDCPSLNFYTQIAIILGHSEECSVKRTLTP
jgi:hypothetical protein